MEQIFELRDFFKDEDSLKVSLVVVALTVVIFCVRWILGVKKYVFTLPKNIDASASNVSYPGYQLPGSILITGGSGFLGKNIIDALLKQPSVTRIVAFDIRASTFEDPRVVMVTGNLVPESAAKAGALVAALKEHKVQAIIHTASPHPNSNNKGLFYSVNVDGTNAVLNAAVTAGVRVFVYTSSASVVWEGQDHAGVDESCPYPRNYRDYYAQTKAIAEQSAMKFGTDNANKIITISLRPHGIFGPGDMQMVPTLMARAKEGKDKWIIGSGDNVVDFTYIGNVVHSHLLAVQTAYLHWKKFSDGTTCPANGKTYFITNGEPLPMWNMLNAFVQGFGYRGGRMRLPAWLLKGVANVQQSVLGVYTAMTGKHVDVTLSASRIEIISTVHWYSIKAATRDLAYKPLWSMEQGIYLTLRAFAHLRNTDPPADVVERAKAAGLTDLELVVDNTKTATVNVPSVTVDVSKLPAFSAAAVAEHNKEKDMWVIVDGLVYNLTRFVPTHPCGIPDIMQHPGQDVSKGFHGSQHPESVHMTLKQYLVGRLEK